MSPLMQKAVRNRLLRALSPDDFSLLQPHLKAQRTELRQTVIEPNEPITQLFFPETGYVSLVTQGAQGDKVEIGIVGREGVVGAAPVLLGSDRTPHHCFVQAAGEMLAIETPALCAAVDQSPTLRGLLLRYILVQFVEASQTAFINASYQLEARLARWILMCHDRVDGDELTMTHDFAAVMLGVQRTSATLGIQALEGRRLIKAQRGRITVTDRPGLVALADHSYGVPEAEYARLIEAA